MDTLVLALKDAPVSASNKERALQVAAKVGGVDPDDLDLILRTLDSLYYVRAHLEAPLEKFVADVLVALRAAGTTGFLATENEQLLRSRLTALLSIASLAVSAKAQVLQRDYSYLFHDAKIITDLRPVFGQNTTDPPHGMILDHTLKLVYHEGLGGHKELYLALDSSDLIELKKVIERAEEKEQVLRTLLASKDLRVF